MLSKVASPDEKLHPHRLMPNRVEMGWAALPVQGILLGVLMQTLSRSGLHLQVYCKKVVVDKEPVDRIVCALVNALGCKSHLR